MRHIRPGVENQQSGGPGNWEGFQKEVEELLKSGVTRERLNEHGFEYTLMLSYMDGEINKDELIEKFTQKN